MRSTIACSWTSGSGAGDDGGGQAVFSAIEAVSEAFEALPSSEAVPATPNSARITISKIKLRRSMLYLLNNFYCSWGYFSER